MTDLEFAQKIVGEINKQSANCNATLNSRNEIIITYKITEINKNKVPTSADLYADENKLNTYSFEHTKEENKLVLIGNEGDTFFQRWDSVKTIPASSDDVNQVVDIASVMIESHINLDGRTDLDRGISKLCSIDWSNFGSLNTVYSQIDNFLGSYDFDNSLNLDNYPSSILWTTQKNSGADVDEWTHITLGSTMAMDGDKGSVRALRRFQNAILAFQDKGIAEVLFNSRTQLSTTEGVPVEIANSGKVDGKRYITSKYGVQNKWSIVEGKAGLYFVDNMNKAFCSFNGQSIDNISEKLGFGSWFRANNVMSSWTPKSFDNIVSFYDHRNSEVYLVRSEEKYSEAPCLVYSETLGAFSSFYDYGSVPMMLNIQDKFISFRDGYLWLQNEGYYNHFFSKVYPYWVTYRVTPDPYGDKIWTNLEYRADAYKVLDPATGDNVISESQLIEPANAAYQSNLTFDDIRIWNEYQQTENLVARAIKKFRTWRVAVPRAAKTDSNKYGLDRIRNPWINLRFKRNVEDVPNENADLMQLHDIIVKYFE